MNIDNLVTMANQIGTFYASFPDHEEARTGIALHLERYWAPRMRKRLAEHVAQTRGAGLDPIVLSALAEHRKGHDVPAIDTSVPEDADTGGDAG
ncbi:formate dehydrogenase subunit delta [Massilia sp. METH4]|uniref:formate dehydrogenase subunit delta n=1 Tax=Massilia sp. METH4 TaxID=3123041 RepID=UPI0030D4652B